jgi:hypothetical protein
MVLDRKTASALTDAELDAYVAAYRQENPRVGEALRLFGISDQAYQDSLTALYRPSVSWTNHANQPAR